MKIKNKTDSTKQLMDLSDGRLVEVGAGKTIELDRATFNKNAFEVVKKKAKKKAKKKYKTETKEKKITEKEVI